MKYQEYRRKERRIILFEVDTDAMKVFIREIGLKQKVISQRCGIPEVRLSLILQGKRKCEAGEYASLCNELGVNPNKFLKPRKTEKTKSC